MNTALTPATPFAKSIQGLEARCGLVPAGWQEIFNRTLSKLVAVQCPARSKVALQGPNLLDISLQIVQVGKDDAVGGILRKLERATAQTCEICSRPGRLRSLGRSVKVLCGSCSGPRFASLAVTQLIETLEGSIKCAYDKPILWDDVPTELRPLLPASAWQLVAAPGINDRVHVTTHSRLRRHGPWLRAIQRALSEAVESQDSS